MKIALGVIIGVILGIVVVGISAFFGLSSLAHAWSHGVNRGPSFPPVGQITTTSSPANGQITTAPSLTTSTSSVPPATSRPPSSSSARVQGSINFALSLISYNVFGPTAATVNVQIKNTGNADAHHVWGKVELYYQGAPVKIDGQDFYRVDIGTLKSLAGVTTKLDLKVNLVDGSKILANGGTFKLTVFSDEYTQNFSFDFKL